MEALRLLGHTCCLLNQIRVQMQGLRTLSAPLYASHICQFHALTVLEAKVTCSAYSAELRVAAVFGSITEDPNLQIAAAAGAWRVRA